MSIPHPPPEGPWFVSGTSRNDLIRRRLIYLITGLGLFIVACLVFILLRPCDVCEAEKVIASRMGVGRSKAEIIAIVNTIKPDSFEKTHELATEDDMPNGECFRMRFDITLLGGRYLNRYFCFDGKGIMFYYVPSVDVIYRLTTIDSANQESRQGWRRSQPSPLQTALRPVTISTLVSEWR